ncbi:hypothetical protein MNBD_PLANCTO02-2144 [hydrothermal vent metagenome]|uniref:Uncharacterized protein n=1 Tax=hydrothermal vent metagenome TaxID=652676 RepID=A0A3B1DNQ3_9ZZZZ
MFANRILFSMMISCFACSLSGCAWTMLDATAVHNPIQALGGSGKVYIPNRQRPALSGEQITSATPQQLAAFYSPIIVQQFKEVSDKGYRYPHDSDLIGEPFLTPTGKRDPITNIDVSQPTMYALYENGQVAGRLHKQLTYTVWYPRHPRTKNFDIEPGHIDSGVVRITLDDNNRPLLYETVLACGCYHKVFVERRIENAAAAQYGQPEEGKEHSIAKNIPLGFDFEVAGIVDSNYDQPAAPVVFVSSGDHKVLGLHSSSQFQFPDENGQVASYRLADYSELLHLTYGNNGATHSMFNPNNDQQVYGADRFERYIFWVIGTDDAGHPRRNDQILLHFDQARWKDPALFNKYLRLPSGF